MQDNRNPYESPTDSPEPQAELKQQVELKQQAKTKLPWGASGIVLIVGLVGCFGTPLALSSPPFQVEPDGAIFIVVCAVWLAFSLVGFAGFRGLIFCVVAGGLEIAEQWFRR